MEQIRFVSLNDEGKEEIVIKNIFNYVLLTTHYRNQIEKNVINKERFWTIQKNLKLFPFFYKELVKI